MSLLGTSLDMVNKDLLWVEHPTELALHRNRMLECTLLLLGLLEPGLEFSVLIFHPCNGLGQSGVGSQELVAVLLGRGAGLCHVLVLDGFHQFLLHFHHLILLLSCISIYPFLAQPLFKPFELL